MSENLQTRRRVSMAQLNNLSEFLNSHREIATGFNKSLTARDHSKRMWESVATMLNSIGEGAIKSGSEWSKYWVDLKSKIKRKNRLINDARRGTGGGPATDGELTEIEINFLQILGEDYGFGLPEVQVDPLVSQEHEDDIGGRSNPGTSQSTATDEPVYLLVESSENENQLNEFQGPHRDTDSTPAAETGGTDQIQVDPPLELLERGPISAPLTDTPATLPRQRPRGPRRRQRPSLYSAVESRQRLIRSCESRQQTELTNSLAIARAVDVLTELTNIIRRIEAK